MFSINAFIVQNSFQHVLMHVPPLLQTSNKLFILRMYHKLDTHNSKLKLI